MRKNIRFNAFEMNCVGHQSPGLWSHPRDRSWEYKDLVYWTDLAKVLEKGIFDGIFIADVIGYYDVYKGSNYHALQQGAQIPVNDPLQLAAPIAMVTEHQRCPDRHPGSATAHKLGITPGRVRHRSFKSMAAMGAHPHLEEHLWYLSEVVFRHRPILARLAV